MRVSSAQLQRLTAEFARTPAAAVCARPEGAYANCYALSVLFARWLRERAVPCQVLSVRGALQPYPQAVGRWPLVPLEQAQHWVVTVGFFAVDWTARQFSPDAEFPYVCRTRELAREWAILERWACRRCNTQVLDEAHCSLSPLELYLQHHELAHSGALEFSDPRHDETALLERLCFHTRREVRAYPLRGYERYFADRRFDVRRWLEKRLFKTTDETPRLKREINALKCVPLNKKALPQPVLQHVEPVTVDRVREDEGLPANPDEYLCMPRSTRSWSRLCTGPRHKISA